jgi:LuxR family maltose regulon positive regulatory protein
VVARLRGNAFIRFDPASGLYAPHSALLDFTREIRDTQPETRKKAILYAAADWCAGSGEREKAIALYYELRDFEKILGLNLSGLEDNRLPVNLNLPNLTYADTLRDITAHCDREMKIRHPMSMIQLAFEFFGQGRYEEFTALRAEMGELIGETPLPLAEQNRLAGELLLLEAFTRYNSIAEMGRRMKAAAELTGGRPSLISQSNSWTFGNASVLLMYHSETGRLDAELADMERYCPYYVTLTEGHGSGGAALMRAEALFCREETKEAEIFCRKARHEAESCGQSSVIIGADLLLGRLAILRGKGSELAAVQKRLTRQAEENPQKSDRMEAGMALAFLDGLLMRPSSPGAADWLLEGTPTSFTRRLFTQAIPYAHLCRARLLLSAGQAEILLGEADAAHALAERLRYPLALIYGHIHNAAAWNMLGEHGKAGIELRKALDMALPDGLHMPFAENSDFLPPVLDSLNRGRPRKGLRRIIALCEAWKTNVMMIRRGLPVHTTPLRAVLTPKQLEQAIMGADGKTYKDLAAIRGVSPATVKRIYANIYARTGINDRETLRTLLLEQRLIAGTPAH